MRRLMIVALGIALGCTELAGLDKNFKIAEGISCVDEFDCLEPKSRCRIATCEFGRCEERQVYPDDYNDCTVDVCQNEVITFTPKPAGEPCGTNAGWGTCDSSGQCLVCMSCAEHLIDPDASTVCEGNSANLYNSFIDCTCLDAVCGPNSAGKECAESCANPMLPPTKGCTDCATKSGQPGGFCQDQFVACANDAG